jgi:hypothetical protein
VSCVIRSLQGHGTFFEIAVTVVVDAVLPIRHTFIVFWVKLTTN